MQQQAFDYYLETQVLTATPQKLRLMLIDSAISSARQTVEFWRQEKNDQALATLSHCRSVISELLSGVTPDGTELTQRVASVYVFLFRSLTEAQLRRDAQQLEQIIEVLQVERETWRLVCEKLPDAPVPVSGTAAAQKEITAQGRAIPSGDSDHSSSSGGFELDA